MTETDLGRITEALAIKIHDAWMAERYSQGWSYGESRNDSLKLHPCLVPYDRLPENEKEVDRSSARASISNLIAMGYVITKKKSGAHDSSASEYVVLRKQLTAKPSPNLAALHSLWQRYRSRTDCPASLILPIGELILKRGEPILAYDILSVGLARAEVQGASGTADTATIFRLRQLLCLALAQSGAADRARAGLEQLRSEGHDTPETLGLLGRAYKDLALQSGDIADRQKHLAAAFLSYRTGFEKGDLAYRQTGKQSDGDDAYYCGINAAATALLQGESNAARRTSERVREICESLLATAGESYWLLATMGEAELISGHIEPARQWYGRAVAKAGDNWRELVSTRRQARFLSPLAGVSTADWDLIFPKIAVVAFESPAWTGGKLPVNDKWYEELQKSIEQRIHQYQLVVGYLTAHSPADIIFGECLLAANAEIHITLPYPQAICKNLFEAEPKWQQRLKKLFAGANSIIDDTQRSCLDDMANLLFAGRRMLGSAYLRARRLDSDLLIWSCAQGPWPRASKSGGNSDGDSQSVRWQRDFIVPGPKDFSTQPEARAGGNPARSSAQAATTGTHEIKAMLFADVKNYSKLNDVFLFQFGRVFTERVAQVLDRYEGKIASQRTAGDGLFLVFSEISAAADLALDLCEMMQSTDWVKLGLPAQLGLRISLDAGPVYVFYDAVMRKTDVCGAYVNRAARIEPITPPNEVYASEAFASLYVATEADRHRFEYVGQTQLPKGFGLTPLYRLSRRNP